MKTCTKCHEKQPLDSFHNHKTGKNGLSSICKSCKSDVDREYRKRPYAIKKERERSRLREDHYGIAKKWTEENRGKVNASIRRYKQKNIQKTKASSILSNEIAFGRIAKPRRCSLCSKIKPLDGHHHDYDKPLDVTWLCRSCHKAIHSKYANEILS